VFRGEGTGLWQAFTWNVGRLVSRILSMLLFRLHVRGQAGIPKTGGVLLIANHQSFLDPWLIGIAPSRQVHYMARDTLFRDGFLQYLGELWNAFPVKRGAADLGAIRMAVERLDKGFMVNIFPEGTRSEDGSIGAIAPGMVLILNRCRTDVPIVPVVIDGAFEAWPRNAKLPRPYPIRIEYGRPIPPSQWRQWSPDELALRVREEMVKLQAELGSKHACQSRRRLAEDQANAAAMPARKRRGDRPS
jgi:1-acyl-sn-glycerol-3-phosphate acyltransferase